MGHPINEYIPAMVNLVIPSIPNIHKNTIGNEPDSVDGTTPIHPSSNKGLEILLGSIRDDLEKTFSCLPGIL